MRKALGEQGYQGHMNLLKQRDAFRPDFTDAVERGKSGREMAEFLNGHAWLWKYVYEAVERDPQYKAMIERGLSLCGDHVPEHWHRAVKMVDENREHVAELKRKYYW